MFELSEKTQAISCGSIGVIMQMVKQLDLRKYINADIQPLRSLFISPEPWGIIRPTEIPHQPVRAASPPGPADGKERGRPGNPGFHPHSPQARWIHPGLHSVVPSGRPAPVVGDDASVADRTADHVASPTPTLRSITRLTDATLERRGCMATPSCDAAKPRMRAVSRPVTPGGPGRGRFLISHRLTYHRWAGRKQVESCYPQFVDFLRLKKRYDPQERFQSDWYNHCKAMFADRI